jgi:ribosomal protein L29
MAYKMKDGKGPNALPLLALIPAAAAAGKAILGAGTLAGAAKAGIAAGTAAAAAKTAAGAAGTAGAIAGKAGIGGKIVAGATKAAKVAKASKVGKALGAVGEKKVLGSTVKEYATSALKNKIMQAPVKAKQEIEERKALEQQKQELFKSKFSPSMMGDKKGPNMEKSKKRIAQDYARNAIVDRKEGRTKDANYEQKQATRVAAGEAPMMMGYNPISKHMGGRGANMYGDPMMMGKKPMMKGENVIVRDAKSGGKKQYNKRGK